MRNLTGFALIVLLFVSSCKKKETLVNAKIIDAGVQAADGCGWLMKVNDITYSPLNLDSNFMMDGLEVSTSFEETGDTFLCGIGAQLKYPIVNISEMENH
ncbi:MAG: hypothetical protein ABIO46_02315 [Chitinophagales bacterium]